jgi:hypothetical protein
MRRHATVAALAAICFWGMGAMTGAHAKCPIPHIMANGQMPDATQMMANFNALVTCLSTGGATNSIQYNAGAGSLAGLGPLTDGQLAIGSTGSAPQAQALSAGTGIAITNAAGSVTIARTAATAGTGLYQQIMSATPTSASTGLTTWLNQGSAVVSNSAVGLAIDAPPSGTTNLSGRYAAAPSTPYTITALLGATRNSVSGSMAGIGWYDGTAKLQVLSYETSGGGTSGPVIRVRQFTNPTTASTVNFTSANNFFSEPIWLQIQDDGTNVSFGFSQDGVNFLIVYSVAKSSGFLGGSGYSNLIFFINPGPGVHGLAALLSWAQT